MIAGHEEEEIEVPKETIEEIENEIIRLESTSSAIDQYADPAHK